MYGYRAPLRDMRFVLHELLGGEPVTALPGCEDATPELIDSVLEQAARLAESELAPLNRSGDEEGCSYENGVVRTPRGFQAAYAAFRAGGWTGVAAAPEWGGQGLPRLVNLALDEMFSSANFSFATYPGLSQGAYDALARHADQRLKAIFLPRLADGSWSGTMCLTEPQCGTDLGLIRTRAVPTGDGSFRVDGTKIFISAGEHDLTENIVHLVLAKLPDAPAGTRGISLFVVPKFLPVEGRGRLGQRRAQRRPLRRHRAQDGHSRLVHLHHAVRRCRGLAGGRPPPGHGRDVHDDERRPPGRRHPGSGRRGGRLPGGPGLRPGAAPGPLAGRPALLPIARPTRSSSTRTCAGTC